MPYSHNCFDCENYFHPSGAIQESFQSDSSEAIISGLFILVFSYHPPNLTGASFKYSLISSWPLRSLVSKLSHVFSFICYFFPVFLYLFFVHFQFLPVVRSRFLFLRYHINLFVVSILPMVRWRPSQVCAISILIPYSGGSSNSWFQLFHLLFFPEFQPFSIISPKAFPKDCCYIWCF